MRVELVKTLDPINLPLCTKGEVLEGTMKKPGMLIVRWETGHVIPMYRDELKEDV